MIEEEKELLFLYIFFINLQINYPTLIEYSKRLHMFILKASKKHIHVFELKVLILILDKKVCSISISSFEYFFKPQKPKQIKLLFFRFDSAKIKVKLKPKTTST